MYFKKFFYVFLVIFFIFFILPKTLLFAQTPTSISITPTVTSTPTPSSDKLNELNNKIEELQNKLNSLQTQSKTLSSEIAVMDSQIKLTNYKIAATQQQISDLEKDIQVATTKVVFLEESLSKIMKIMVNRMQANYKVGTIPQMQLLLLSNDISSFVLKSYYLRYAQQHDKKLLLETQQAKKTYEEQKDIFEKKKQQVLSLKTQLEQFNQELDGKKKAKQILLDITKNDEKKYQALLAQARAEYEAIQGIIAGNGTETEVGPVNEGQRIATVISGVSCNSGGTHLHFIVRQGTSTLNPFQYLKSVEINNCSGSSCGSGDGDPANPAGSWNWPIDPPIKLTQGYGSTWAVRNSYVGRIYSFHNGIDIYSDNLEVKAVQPGILYRGSYAGGGGCRLRYVRVKHTGSDLDTLYLHINY